VIEYQVTPSRTILADTETGSIKRFSRETIADCDHSTMFGHHTLVINDLAPTSEAHPRWKGFIKQGDEGGQERVRTLEAEFFSISASDWENVKNILRI